MMNVAFLCSGGGGNLKFVSQALRMGWLQGVQICAVVSDRECGANAHARHQGLVTEVMDFSPAGQCQVISRLQNLHADVIVTTIHKVLIPSFLSAFKGKIINLHYSLLPAFAGKIGTRPVSEALAYGSKFVGVTVHHVSEQVDMGRPIVQAVLSTPSKPVFDVLMNVLFRSGCIALLHAIATIPKNRLHQAGQPCTSTWQGGQMIHFNPAVRIDPALNVEQGWEFLS